MSSDYPAPADSSPADSSSSGSGVASRSGGPPWVMIAVAVALVLVALLVGVLLRGSDSAQPSSVGSQEFSASQSPVSGASSSSSPSIEPQIVSPKVPPGVDPETLAVRVGTSPSAPLLSVWEDFQCPACGLFESSSGDTIRSLVGEGKLTIEWRPVSFLDEAFNNDASQRATAAWGCAIEQGAAPQYHDVVFANQPVVEGQGFSDGQLREFAVLSGIEGAALAEFDSCVAEGRYLSWSVVSTGMFRQSGYTATPHAIFEGEPISPKVLVDAEALRSLVLSMQ